MNPESVYTQKFLKGEVQAPREWWDLGYERYLYMALLGVNAATLMLVHPARYKEQPFYTAT